MSQLNTDHVTHTGRSRLYFGNYTGAIESFNMVIKIKPYLPEPYFYRGVAKLNLDDYRGAKRDLDKALEIKPFFPDAYMYRGIVNYNLQNYNKAMEDYSRAMELDGENADIYNNRGICKAAMRDFDGAIADYTKSIELKPKNFNAYLNRSIAYQIQGEWQKAIDDCNQLIRIRPNSPMGYLSRGLIKIEKEDYASALRDFDMAIYLDPRNAFAYQNRGMVKQQLESYESAIMDYSRAIELDPTMASAYFNRGIAREMTRNPGYQDDYDNAALLDPRFAQKPWQTQEERDRAYQQQMANWQKQQKSKTNSRTTENNTEADSTSQAKSNTPDLDELRKRKMIANLVVEDNRNIPGEEKENSPRVQDQNIEVGLLPHFEITTIDKKLAEQEDVGYFDLTIENLNAANNYDPYLTISNKPPTSNEAIEYYNNQVLIFSERIKQNPGYSDNYLYRGIFKTLINDYSGAISDFDTTISMNERNLLAYYMRAVARTKIIATIEMMDARNQLSINNKNTSPLFQDEKTNATNYEAYGDILTDYTVVLYMNPDFLFAYYNRGNIYCNQEKYFQAIEEYDKAISINHEFAEAYYNRGLVKILLNKIDEAARDLSKAGELGVSEAYNVIKRYCN